VVSLGAIGQAFIDRLAGMDVHTVGVRYIPERDGPTDKVIGFDEHKFYEALSRTNYLVLSTPLTDMTRGLVGREELTTLSPRAVVVNVSRDAVLNTEALTRSIQHEDIWGAAMDVIEPEPLLPEHPLWRFENVFITPHMGGHTSLHWDRLTDILAENVTKIDGGDLDSLRNVVNGAAAAGEAD